MIREAVSDDIPQLIEWGARFHELSQLPFEYDPVSTAASLEGLIASPDAAVLLHDYGFIIGVLAPVWFSGSVQAAELAWWAEKNGLALFKAFEAWARDKGAGCVVMAHLESSAGDDDRVGKIYERRGYVRAETGFRKVL